MVNNDEIYNCNLNNVKIFMFSFFGEGGGVEKVASKNQLIRLSLFANL